MRANRILLLVTLFLFLLVYFLLLRSDSTKKRDNENFKPSKSLFKNTWWLKRYSSKKKNSTHEKYAKDTNLDNKVEQILSKPLNYVEEDIDNEINDTYLPIKKIFLYTTWFFKPEWNGLTDNDLVDYTHKKKCKVKACEISYSHFAITTADALIFHEIDMENKKRYSREALMYLSRSRPNNQKWVFYTQENPTYKYHLNLTQYNGLFNWTMTYSRKSNIYLPYAVFEKTIKGLDRIPPKYQNYAEGKDKLAVWAASNCGRLRDSYILELERYIDVTVYGGCSAFHRLRGDYCERGTQKCIEKLQRYKFYLAFENALCEDYITEKYWESSLEYGLIPVVIATPYFKQLAIPGSYIDVLQFSSIEKLANYLLFLDRNNTAYNEYFSWKQKYKINKEIDGFCKLCAALHNGDTDKNVYWDLNKFWTKKTVCEPYNNVADALEEQIKHSKLNDRKEKD